VKAGGSALKSRGAGDPSSEAPSHLPGQITRLLAEVLAVPAEPLAPASAVGDRIGRFLLVRAIGRGGFGLVFEAEDTDLRRRVAIKVLRPERSNTPTTLEWIRREGEAAARVRHPAVVTLHDVGQWEGGTYLVYEFLEGETLSDRLDRGPLGRKEARRVLRSVAVGLAQMHAAGVVHRDLKPDNIFIEADGNVKILDLGLAQVAGAVGIRAGSPPYVAPEQWRGEATDARADVYAWGVLARKLLTGRPSGDGKEASASSLHSLRTLVERARSQNPAPRPVDGAALLAELDRIEHRKRRVALLATAAAGLAVVGAFYGLGRALKPSPGAPSGPFRVAVADAENGSTESGISSLAACNPRPGSRSSIAPGSSASFAPRGAPLPTGWTAAWLASRPARQEVRRCWCRRSPRTGRRSRSGSRPWSPRAVGCSSPSASAPTRRRTSSRP